MCDIQNFLNFARYKSDEYYITIRIDFSIVFPLFSNPKKVKRACVLIRNNYIRSFYSYCTPKLEKCTSVPDIKSDIRNNVCRTKV